MSSKSLAMACAAGSLLLSACADVARGANNAPIQTAQAVAATTVSNVGADPTALPTRPNFKPGELVDYVAQTGDTLPALAARFNTTIPEIREANPLIPPDATTMPPGFPMRIPIYFRSLWGTAFQIIPDSAFVNGPAQIGFSSPAYVAGHEGWFTDYWTYAAGRDRTGAEIVDYVATSWSISPRLLLAVLEYKSGALTAPDRPAKRYILDFEQRLYAGATNLNYLQLVWAANTLNTGYYGWRSGKLTEFEAADGTIVRPDPWLNAGTVAMQYFFSRTESGDQYGLSVGSSGFFATYQRLFGDPFDGNLTLIPGSLQQPALTLPYRWRQVWAYTGGPHTGWGSGEPLAAIDFAPPCDGPGCAGLNPQTQVLAMADGVVVRAGPDGVVLDLDQDGDERTGWTLFYLHLAASQRVTLGQQLRSGDAMGYPSSEGGESTGTHIHIARKYNGEWIMAGGPLAFDVGGWIAEEGQAPYLGTLTRNGISVRACSCSDLYSAVPAIPEP